MRRVRHTRLSRRSLSCRPADSRWGSRRTEVVSARRSARSTTSRRPTRPAASPPPVSYWVLFVSHAGGAWVNSDVGASNADASPTETTSGFRYDSLTGADPPPASPAGTCPVVTPPPMPTRTPDAIGQVHSRTADPSPRRRVPRRCAHPATPAASTTPTSGILGVATPGATAAPLASLRSPRDQPGINVGILLAAIGVGALIGLLGVQPFVGGVANESARARRLVPFGHDHRARHRESGVSGARAALRAQRPRRVAPTRRLPPRPAASRWWSRRLIAIAVTTLASHTGDHAFLVLPPAIPVIGGSLTARGGGLRRIDRGRHRGGRARRRLRCPSCCCRTALVDALPECPGAYRCGDRDGAQPDPGHRAQRNRDPRRATDARLASPPCPRVAGSRGTGRADRARELDHPRRSDGGARLRLGSANPLRRPVVWRWSDIAVCVVAPAAAVAFVALRVVGRHR